MKTRFLGTTLFILLSLPTVLIFAGDIEMRPRNILLPGDKEIIVDSLDAAGIFMNDEILRDFPDSVRDPHRLGFMTGPPTVSLPVNTSVFYLKTPPILRSAGLSLADVIDSVSVGHTVYEWNDAQFSSVSLSDPIVTWLTDHQAILVERVLWRAVPGESFVVPISSGSRTFDLSTYYEILFDSSVLVDTILESLRGVTGIDDAYVVGRVRLLDSKPPEPHIPDCQYTDTLNTLQWYLKNSTDTSIGINAFRAWDLTCDSSVSERRVLIGVPDGGFCAYSGLHPRLRQNIAISRVDADVNHGVHGTAVAGVIGAATEYNDNDIPILSDPLAQHLMPWGVSPRAKMAVTDLYDSTDYHDDLQYLIDSSAVRLMNFSWLVTGPDPALEALLYKAYYEKNIVLIGGAGNCDFMFFRCPYRYLPAVHPCVIAVGGIEVVRDTFRNVGNWKFNVLTAPAERIFTSGDEPKSPDSIAECYGYGSWSGTSFSSPMVVGTAALIMAAYPNISWSSVGNVLAASTQKKPQTGWDPKYGYGILDAGAAVQRVVYGLDCHGVPGDVNIDCFVNYADVELLSDYLSGGCHPARTE